MMFQSKASSFISFFLFSLQQGFSNGQVLINEVAVTSIPNVCFTNDYVELINTGTTAVNLSGWVLYDNAGPSDADAFILPPQLSLAAGEIRFFCRNDFGSFKFGIENGDNVTLANPLGVVASTTGNIPGAGSTSLSFQRLGNGTYDFSAPTPGTVNFVLPLIGNPIINEVAPGGTTNATLAPCFGAPFVELYNDAIATVNLTGYTLKAGASTYTFINGTINRFAYFTLCGGAGIFTIDANDNVTLSNAEGAVLSFTGPIGGGSPRPVAAGVAWVRVTDFIITSAPFKPFYQYSTTPTPGRSNIFPFNPVQLPILPCGIQTAPLAMASDYVFKSITNANVNYGNPELSGGTFDPRTCNHISVGDGATMHEFSIVGNTVNTVIERPLIGGSRASVNFGNIPDSEGICFYRDTVNGDKLAILDERARSVLICDIPLSTQLVPIFRDSSNCRVARLSPAQIANPNVTNAADNGSFEAIACDPANGKLYVGNEEAPMLIWSVDVATGVFDVLIDVQRRPEWTSQIVEISGLTYDPVGKSLYVLSAVSQLILQSSLNGTLIGSALNVSQVDDPGGLSYEPTTGDLIIFGEPRQVARFSKRIPTKAPTKTPTKSPTKRPSKRPTKAPTKTPTKAPTKTPTTAPVRPNCGLLGLNIFCPFTFCGLFGRLLGICD